MIGMKILALTVVVTMIAALQQGVTSGRTEPDGKKADVPPRCTSDNCYIKLWQWRLLLGTLLSPISTTAASFDCSQAKRTLEVLICADPELSSLDGQMGEAYSAARSTVPKKSNEAAGLLSEQRTFLKNRTDICHIPGNPVLPKRDTSRMITCLKGLYTLRLNELQKRLAASGSQNAETGPDQKEVGVPPDLVATLKDDLKYWEGDDDGPSPGGGTVGECLKDLKENVLTTWFYHNSCDNRPEQAVLVKGMNCLATANNGPILLYIRSGNGLARDLLSF
jgi:uncharacterized protein YecT (DUF1311 family)